MNDIHFTNKINAWFDSEHTEENIRQGAMLLLQMNNNRYLFQQINFDPMGKLELLKYELQKHLNYRVQGLTIDEVREFDKKVTPILQTAIDKTTEADRLAAEIAPHLPQVEGDGTDIDKPSALIAKGKRADHEKLPQKIQEIWDNNAVLWRKIQEHFEAAKAYEQSCDRYEGLHAANEDFKRLLYTLKLEYYAYKQGMEQYDNAEVDEAQQEVEAKTDAAITANQISNARSYITKNLDKVIGFQNQGDTARADDWRAKVQQRVDLLITAKAEITADTIAKLQQAGIIVKTGDTEVEIDASETSEEEADEGESDSTSPEATQDE